MTNQCKVFVSYPFTGLQYSKKKKKTVVGETEQVIRRQKADIVLIHSAYQTERTMNNVVYRFHRYIRMTVAKHLFHVRCRKLTHFFFLLPSHNSQSTMHSCSTFKTKASKRFLFCILCTVFKTYISPAFFTFWSFRMCIKPDIYRLRNTLIYLTNWLVDWLAD